jgi:hypothetical protein
MNKLLLVSVLAFVSSGAFAQSSQSQGSAQADTNGNVATTLERSSEASNAWNELGCPELRSERNGQ